MDGWATAHSEREREFTLANNVTGLHYKQHGMCWNHPGSWRDKQRLRLITIITYSSVVVIWTCLST